MISPWRLGDSPSLGSFPWTAPVKNPRFLRVGCWETIPVVVQLCRCLLQFRSSSRWNARSRLTKNCSHLLPCVLVLYLFLRCPSPPLSPPPPPPRSFPLLSARARHFPAVPEAQYCRLHCISLRLIQILSRWLSSCASVARTGCE